MMNEISQEELESEVEIEDRLEQLGNLLKATKPEQIDLLIARHRQEIDALLKFKRLITPKNAAAKGERLEAVKNYFASHGNGWASIPQIAAALEVKSNLITVAFMRGKKLDLFEQKGKEYRLKNFKK